MTELTNIDLPNNWIIAKLSDMVIDPKSDFVDGPFGSNLKANEYRDEGVPVFRIQNIKAGYFLDKNIQFVTPQKAEQIKRHSFKFGDIIITKLGEPLGLCCKVPAKYPSGIIVADLMRVRPSNIIVNTDYLVYAINSKIIQDQFKRITKGTTRARVNLTIVRDIEIPLAPIKEQNRIVDKLDELLSELEKGKEQLKTSLEQLKVYRQSILKHAFEGKLTEDWRRKQKKVNTPDELVDEIKAYRKQQYEKQLKEYKAGKVKEKPKEPKDITILKDSSNPEIQWALSRLGDIVETTSGGTPSRNNPNYYSGKIPWVKSGELRFNTIINTEEKITKEAIENSSAKLFPKGTLLVALYGANVGKLAFLGIEAATNQAIAGIFEDPFYDLDFLYYYLVFRRTDLLNQSTGGAQPNISQTILNNLPIPLCTIEEQKEIVQQIDKLFSLNSEMEKTIEENLLKSDSLKQGLLQKAFEGKLVEQDPADEPASALLERIKKEREEYLKVENERKKNQNNPMKKKSTVKVFELPIVDKIKDKFGKKSFTFEQLKSEVDINYDDLREELFSLLDNEKILTMEFDQKNELMYFKYVGQ